MARRPRKQVKRRKRRDNAPPGGGGRLSPQFRFEPGSYGGGGRFVPSIACLKQTAPNQWDYHFVLVRSDQSYPKEKRAVLQAEKDLAAAFSKKQMSGSEQAVAEHLRGQGYLSMTNFQVVAE
ncbi:MAG: hypothetical protein GY796_23195 [Chloroflexi bacterium]|nr:hypothetical protein [Chloroflexota bacterium]